MACYRGEYTPSHPQFAEASGALCRGEIQPVAISAPDIEYTEDDEKAIEQYTRKSGALALFFFSANRHGNLLPAYFTLTVATAWHSVRFDDLSKCQER